MDNEFELELDKIEQDEEGKLKVKNRFEKLTEKSFQSAKLAEEAEARAKAAEEARLNAERERDFFKDFSSKSSKYPNATAHQDKIWEKVRGGYDTEDAILSVLNKEGQLNPQEPRQSQPTAEGGSAITTLNEGGSKDIKDMSADEKLSALLELEKKGAISL